MSEFKRTEDFVVTSPCGCKITYVALMKHKGTQMHPCKDHVNSFDLGPREKTTRAAQRQELLAEADKQLHEAMSPVPSETAVSTVSNVEKKHSPPAEQPTE